MVAGSIAIEPNGSAIVNYAIASYRQIRFEVLTRSGDPDSIVAPNQPMYADVYDNLSGNFIQTLTSYSIEQTFGVSIFVFDIQDVVQWYITQFIPNLQNGLFVAPGFAVESDDDPIQSAYLTVYFRGSSFSGGLLIPEATAPTQGTATTAPINTYSGLPCNTFSVIKSSILPGFESVFDNPLQERLGYNLQSGFIGDTQIYPLSNLPVNTVGAGNPNPDLCPVNYTDQPGGFPIWIMSFQSSGMLSLYARNCTFYIAYSVGPVGLVTYLLLYATPQLLTNGLWYIPLGLKEIINAQPSLAPIFNNANNNIYYRIIVQDVDASVIAFITPLYKAQPNPSNSNGNINVLWFQNTYGHFEQVAFIRSASELNISSSEQFTPYTETGTILLADANNPLQVGSAKYNVRANDEITMTALFPEQLMPWLRELFFSPYILMRIPDIRTHPPSSDIQYLLQQVKISDVKQTIKRDPISGGKKYSVTVKVVPSVEYIIPRN